MRTKLTANDRSMSGVAAMPISVFVLFGIAIASAMTVYAQVPQVALIPPSTALDAAVAQIARFYRQPIGLEYVTDQGPLVGSEAIDLSTLTLPQALARVLARTPRPYRWQGAGDIVMVRPVDSESDSGSWLNLPPTAPGLRFVPSRDPRFPGRGRMGILVDPHVPAVLENLTLGESWLELQRPKNWKPLLSRLQKEQAAAGRIEEFDRRVTVASETTVWSTIASVMWMHDGVSAWTLSHPGTRAIQGQTSVQIAGKAGWSLSLAGVPPGTDLMSVLDPLYRDRIWNDVQSQLAPTLPPSPPPGR